MPSFATLFIAATAALAAFASAAPMAGTDLAGATGPLTNAGSTVTGSLGGADQLGRVAGQKRDGDATAYIDQIKQSIENGATSGQQAGGAIAPPDIKPPTTTKRGDDIPSLPEILIKLKVQVGAISERLHRIIVADAKVEAKVLLPILDELCDVLGGAVLEVKALAGLSIDVVLALHGSVIAIVDVANLLAVVLCIVYSILAIVIQAVGSVEPAVINPALALVAGVVVDLLAAAFVAVNGLRPVLVPLCETIISLTRVWGFANVLAVLQV